MKNRFVFSKLFGWVARHFLKNDCGARPKGTNTKALARCHEFEDFDTRHEDFNLPNFTILPYREVDTLALPLFTSKALFVAGKGRLGFTKLGFTKGAKGLVTSQ